MISMRLSEAAKEVNGKFSGEDVFFNGCSTDTRTLDHGNLFIALQGEHFDGHSFIASASKRGAVAAMVESDNAATMLPLLTIEDSVQAMGILAKYWRSKFDIPLLAITGSNGKTTVKEMVKSILELKAGVLSTKGNLNNHIGVPLTLLNLGSEHEYGVVEMGANHPGEIEWLSQLARPTIALITQCAPAHLEGFGSEDGVANAKAEVFTGLCDNGIAIVNADDKYAESWKSVAEKYRKISFGLEKTADITATKITFSMNTGKTSFSMHFPDDTISISIPLVGIHNVQNSIAAAACCLAIGIPILDVKEGLEKMHYIRGRMQMFNISDGSRVFDDTYNANPASLKAALRVISSYKGDKSLVLGEMRELGEGSEKYHEYAGELARLHGIRKLYAYGDLTRHTVRSFGSGAMHFTSKKDLISEIKQDLKSKATILVKGSRMMGMESIVQALKSED